MIRLFTTIFVISILFGACTQKNDLQNPVTNVILKEDTPKLKEDINNKKTVINEEAESNNDDKKLEFNIEEVVLENDSFKIVYPEFTSNYKEFDVQINQIIKNDIEWLLKIYPQHSVEVKYEVYCASDKLISIVYNGYAYTENTPYPSNVYFSTNMDKRTKGDVH